VKALILTLPGASLEPHVVTADFGPVPGYYHPTIPTPVGGPGELPLDMATAYAENPTTHLGLVDVPKGDVDAARDFWSGQRDQLRAGVVSAMALAEAGSGDIVRATDEAVAFSESVPPTETEET